MSYQAEVTVGGKVIWGEVKPSPQKAKGVQAGMFMDRPDLWPMRRRGDRKAVTPPPGQLKLELAGGIDNR